MPGQRWIFRRNDAFPSELGGPPHIAQLVIAVVDEPTTKFAGLASGDLDFAGIAPTMAALAARDPTIRVQDYPILLSIGLVLNAHRAPFDDVPACAMRSTCRSIADASSRPHLPGSRGRRRARLSRRVRSRFSARGHATRAPPTHCSMRPAGVAPRTGCATASGKRFSVEMLTVGAGDHALEQLVQADLAERGIRVDIRDMEFGAFITRARQRPVAFDLLITGITGDVSLAYLASMYDTRQRGGALDYADYHTPRLDALFAAARAASGPAAADGVA